MATRIYIVLKPVRFDKLSRPGATLKLADEQAAPMLALGFIALAPAETEAESETDRNSLADLVSLESMTKAQLVKHALDAFHLALAPNLTKPEMVAAIHARFAEPAAPAA